MTNRITATAMIARPAPPPSSPALRRAAPRLRDLTARRGQANSSAMPLISCSRCSETKFTRHRDPLHKASDTPAS